MKTCSFCGETKPVAEFSRDSKTKDGLHCHCKNCCKERTIKWVKDNPERAAENVKSWRKANPEKKLANDRAWDKANPEKVYVSKKAYADANREEILAKNRIRANANPEKGTTRMREWRRANPEKALAAKHNRRALISGNGGVLSVGRKDKLFVLQRGRCAICKIKLVKAEMDHYIPVKLGGSSDDLNFQLLCKPCNCKKNAKDPIDYMQSLGYLL